MARIKQVAVGWESNQLIYFYSENKKCGEMTKINLPYLANTDWTNSSRKYLD